MGFRGVAVGVAACVVSSWLCPRPALGQDATTRVAARELAVAGAEAFDKQDFATALDRFQRAEQLYKVPSIAVMVARCLASTGRVVEAVDKYEETLRMPLEPGAPEAFQRAVAEATTEVEVVRSRVARLELHLPPDAPADARVQLDGHAVPPALIGVAMPVDPGTHRVQAEATGKAPYSSELALVEGARQSLDISFLPAQPASSDAERASWRSRRPSTLTVALLAGGGVAIIAGTVAGVAALNYKSNLDESCHPGCPPSLSDDLDGFRRNRTLSYLGIGIGLASAGAGAYLLLHEGPTGRKVGAVLLPGGAAVAGRF